MMPRRIAMLALGTLATVAGLAACRDVTAGPCGPSDKPAFVLSAYDGGLSNPVHDVTIVYDRHGDDSLTVLRDLPTAINVAFGNRPGIYDVRLMAPGYADYLWTNIEIAADGCDPRKVEGQVFMQKLP